MNESADQDWTDVEERGVPWLFRFLLALYKRGILNWWIAQGIMYVITSVYFVIDRDLREASIKYLRRRASHRQPDELPPNPGIRHCYRHVLEFGRSIFDRFSCWMGEQHRYDIHPHGEELFTSIATGDQGAILLSFHAGNPYLMRYMALEQNFKMNIVAYWDNSPMLQELLEYVDPSSQLNILKVDASEPQSILNVKDRIDNGELVAILADRKSAGTSSRDVQVPFLGGWTSLPTGPYIIAHVLDCPVLLTYALRTGPRTYDMYAEMFAERISLPRSSREDQLEHYAGKLAKRMEEISYRAPYQWYNFYDFWEQPRDNSSEAERDDVQEDGI